MQSQTKKQTKKRSSPNKNYLCFVIMPFGKKRTEKSKHYTMVYEHVITRAVQEAGFDCKRADEIPDSGPIPEEVKKQLRTAELVLADLSDRNPNVFYELGYRHALNKPLITISDDVSSIPFNMSPYRTIEYTTENISAADQARDKIREYAIVALKQIESQPHSKGKFPITHSATIEILEAKIDQGFSNVYEQLSKGIPLHQEETLIEEVAGQREVHQLMQSTLEKVSEKAEAMVTASRLLQQTADYGLVSIYPTRMDAIEEFFSVIGREDRGIDIVGSTIFGLQGGRNITRDKILELLKFKSRQGNFTLRILLTHWDYISHRQDQEKTEKNITRFVISKELKEAVDLLKFHELTNCVRFYRAAPTCFTLICHGQGMLLANPYPYEKEAYNSWTVLFRHTTPGTIYESFSSSHFDQPWNNKLLCIPFDQACEEAVSQKLRKDLAQAQREMAAAYESPDL